MFEVSAPIVSRSLGDRGWKLGGRSPQGEVLEGVMREKEIVEPGAYRDEGGGEV